jgi:hypothetical protein
VIHTESIVRNDGTKDHNGLDNRAIAYKQHDRLILCCPHCDAVMGEIKDNELNKYCDELCLNCHEVIDLKRPNYTLLDTSCITSENFNLANGQNGDRYHHPFASMYCLECGGILKIPIWCGDRLCPICAKQRARKYAKYLKVKVKGILANRRRVRFITLTVRNTWKIDYGFKNLRTAFTRLRGRTLWKDNVLGGCYGIEVTNDGNGWHVHLHIFYDGKYIDHESLSHVWSEVTGDNSFIVDIREVKDYRGAIRELAKYPFKPADVDKWSEVDRKEFGKFMYNRRLFEKFGSWYGDGNMRSDVTICPFCHAENSLMMLESQSLSDQITFWNDHFARIDGVGLA